MPVLFPGGIPSHVSPECPRFIHEGGELGYSLSTPSARYDNPDLIVACVVVMANGNRTARDRLAFQQVPESGHRWRGSPILHLNGYKIANPTILARISRTELRQLLKAAGGTDSFCRRPGAADETGSMPTRSTRSSVAAGRFTRTRVSGATGSPAVAMIVLESPKGWTGPKEIDGSARGTFRAHQSR